MKLKHIAEITNGFTFRAKPRDDKGGNMRIIQVGDIQLDGSLDVSASPRIHYSDGYDKFIVKEGDIVFRGRAGTAAALVHETEVPLIVASPLVIIRADKSQALPDYIAWYINSSHAARYFSRAGQGMLVKAVGIKELAQLEVPLPPLSTQQEIAEVSALADKERQLLKEIRQRKHKLVTQALLNTAHQHSQQRKRA